jgi:hypothetical protein
VETTMILDTRSPVFYDALGKHLEKRLKLLLKMILTQDISTKAKSFETRIVNEIDTRLKEILPLINHTEKTLETMKLFDRTKVE